MKIFEILLGISIILSAVIITACAFTVRKDGEGINALLGSNNEAAKDKIKSSAGEKMNLLIGIFSVIGFVSIVFLEAIISRLG